MLLRKAQSRIFRRFWPSGPDVFGVRPDFPKEPKQEDACNCHEYNRKPAGQEPKSQRRGAEVENNNNCYQAHNKLLLRSSGSVGRTDGLSSAIFTTQMNRKRRLGP